MTSKQRRCDVMTSHRRWFNVVLTYVPAGKQLSWTEGAQWLSGRVFDSRPRGRGFEPQRRHCVVSLSKNTNPSLVLVQPRKTRPFITERLLMGRRESNQTNKQNHGQKYTILKL